MRISAFSTSLPKLGIIGLIINSSGWVVVTPSCFKTCFFLIIADEDHLLYPYLPFSYLLWDVCCVIEFLKLLMLFSRSFSFRSSVLMYDPL